VPPSPMPLPLPEPLELLLPELPLPEPLPLPDPVPLEPPLPELLPLASPPWVPGPASSGWLGLEPPHPWVPKAKVSARHARLKIVRRALDNSAEGLRSYVESMPPVVQSMCPCVARSSVGFVLLFPSKFRVNWLSEDVAPRLGARLR